MASRNLTGKFEDLRRVFSNQRGSANAKPSKDPYRSQQLSDGDSEPSSSLPSRLPESLPPQWVDLVEEIRHANSDIKRDMIELDKMHKARLKVSFSGDQSEKEREIEILTQQISQTFRKSENNLKRIAIVGTSSGVGLSQEERQVRLNVMRNLATEVQALSKDFRHMQKDFYDRMKKQDTDGGVEGLPDNMMNLNVEENMPEEYKQELRLLEEKATDRQKEILRIVQSVQELSQLFRELNMLIVEQGSVVDRIDYNVERALLSVKEGKKEIDKANEISKKALSLKIIIVLLLIVVGLIIYIVCKRGYC